MEATKATSAFASNICLLQEANNKERAKMRSSSDRHPTDSHLLMVFDKKATDKYCKPSSLDDLCTSQQPILQTSTGEQPLDTPRRKDASQLRAGLSEKEMEEHMRSATALPLRPLLA